MIVYKVDELFNGGRISSALNKDIANSTLFSFIGDIKSIRNCEGIFNNKRENFNNIYDCIDFLLDCNKLYEGKYDKVDLEKYINIDIKNIGLDYGFNKVYLGIINNSTELHPINNLKSLELELLISDKRYINIYNRLSKETPVIIAGKIIINK